MNETNIINGITESSGMATTSTSSERQQSQKVTSGSEIDLP